MPRLARLGGGARSTRLRLVGTKADRVTNLEFCSACSDAPSSRRANTIPASQRRCRTAHDRKPTSLLLAARAWIDGDQILHTRELFWLLQAEQRAALTARMQPLTFGHGWATRRRGSRQRSYEHRSR